MVVYLIGSLRNPEVPKVAKILRDRGLDVFDDWHAGGEKADEEWMKYEQGRGRDYHEALDGHAAKHTFEYDKFHLDRAHVGVMVAPCGKSGHLELGYLLGQGKPGYIYMEHDPERWDVMVLFATKVVRTVNGLVAEMEQLKARYHNKNLRPGGTVDG
jgi:hypothetical protein